MLSGFGGGVFTREPMTYASVFSGAAIGVTVTPTSPQSDLGRFAADVPKRMQRQLKACRSRWQAIVDLVAGDSIAGYDFIRQDAVEPFVLVGSRGGDLH